MKLPTDALIFRPDVDKLTIFNKLLKKIFIIEDVSSELEIIFMMM